MPQYIHQCRTCGRTVEEFRKLADYARAPQCCGVPMPQNFDAAVRASYKRPVRLESMGFLADPEDVAEHRRRFPNIDLEFCEGSAIPVMRSRGQKKAYFKERGLVDLRSYD
jgi:hypothetical protein